MDWVIILYMKWMEPSGSVQELVTVLEHPDITDHESCRERVRELGPIVQGELLDQNLQPLMIAARCVQPHEGPKA